MSGFDLNLLYIFDLLFEERSVSRAAQRLNLTQSAVSHALGRLRKTVGDPLFTRGARGLSTTARAEELAPQVREILVGIRSALNPPSFDPLTSRRGFTLAAGSYICRLVVPHLIELMREAAPDVALRIVNIDQTLLADLDQGLIDVAIGSFGPLPTRIAAHLLFRDKPVWVSRRRHPLAGATPDRAMLLAQPHISIMPDYPFRPRRRGGTDDRIARRSIIGDAGTVRGSGNPATGTAATVYDADTAVAVLARSDLLAILPRLLVLARADAEGLHLFDVLTGAPEIELTMLWHGRFAQDQGLLWLRDLIIAASALIG